MDEAKVPTQPPVEELPVALERDVFLRTLLCELRGACSDPGPMARRLWSCSG